MNNNSIFLLDPQFNTKDAINCNLLLSINESCFSYAIVSNNDDQIKAIFDIQACENVDKTVEDHFKTDELLTLKYNSIKAAFYTENEVLVPDEFYKDRKLESFKNFFKDQSIEKLYVNEGLTGFNALFSLQKNTDNYFKEESISKYHQVASMLVLADTDGLYLNFTASSVYFLYKKEGSVIFQNQYQVANADEFNYYLLLVLNMLKITANEIPVNVSGIINEGDSKYVCMQRFFTTVNFIDPKKIDVNNSILENLPQHYFSALLALNLCA